MGSSACTVAMPMMTRAFLVTCGMIIFSASISAVPVVEESTNPSYDPVVETFRLSEVDPNVNLQTAQKLGKAKAYKTFKITWGTKTEAACKAQCTCKPPNKGGPKWCKSSIGPMSAGGCKKGVKLCRKPCKRYRFTANTKTCELFTYGTEGKSITPMPKPTPKKPLSCCTSDVISGAKRCGSAAAARSCATRLANCKKYPYMSGAISARRHAFSVGCDKFIGRGKSACLQECHSTKCGSRSGGPWGREEFDACIEYLEKANQHLRRTIRLVAASST